MNNFNYGISTPTPEWIHAYAPALFLLALWSIFWKGLALWHSGRRGQAWWFVVLLIINTGGILEIVYLFGIIKLKVSKLFSK